MSRWQARLEQVHQAVAGGELQRAKVMLQRLLTTERENPRVLATMARVLRDSGQFTESAYYARRASVLEPGNPALLTELGMSLARAGDPAAEDALRRALALQPDNRAAQVVLCKLLDDAARWADLAQAGRAAIDGGAVDAGLYMGTAGALTHLCRTDEAARVIGRAQLAFPSDYPIAQLACFCQNYTWPIDRERAFAVHRNHGRLITQNDLFVRRPLPRPAEKHGPLRVAFFSSDLREHSVASFIAPLFANLDRSRFHVTGVLHNTRTDAVTERLKALCDGWEQISGGTYAGVADQMRALSFDIAVDLNGVTGGNVLPLFQIGIAPVQATYLGYPNTTGLESVNYRIVDSRTDPNGDPYDAQQFAVERLVRIDPCFLCYTPPPAHQLPSVGRRELHGDRPLTLGCFNASFKINPHILGLWKRILDAMPGARLVYRSASMKSADTVEAIGRLFAEHGLAEDRVEIRRAAETPADHLVQYQHIDIALDSFPYHGTTTTCEALLMGVPVVSRIGTTHASRVGLSLLAAAGVPELAAASDDDYVRLVIDLANDRERLAGYHASLRSRLLSSELCDAAAMGDRFGNALMNMWNEAIRHHSSR